MLRRPVFWVALILLSALAAVFTVRNFSDAFPLVSIDLTMDRAGALSAARSLSTAHSWPPNDYDQAAQFSANQEVQNFIELEGGGKPELARILKDGVFALYTWRVRHFKEGDSHETFVQFTPSGQPYGFRVKLPDQEAGASLSVEEAQRIAEDAAKSDWKIDFGRYQLVESSKEDRPGGRTDHTFVYERQDERIREGRYRLRLVVGGDRLTELTRFVQIPEAFTRRYQQLRSINDAISAVDTIAVLGLYLLGFCGVGLFFMIRLHWVVWRQAALWGILIAFLMAAQQLNQWPLLWMSYDTAVPAGGFALQQVVTALAAFGGYALLLTISFMAAETLSRRAFPGHIQLWKVWSRPVASSRAVFGQTLVGYLLVALFFAYEIVLYFFAQGKLGWWTPSDTLVNPDMFANYLPSLSAVAQAAQAGFWEECLFRAAPLATAALIGAKFGRRRAFIAGAMILQALVFAAGHAGYANQPAYARVVELIIPALAFGILYLLFGLLPGIILHFAYDAAWMSLPLFVSSSGRAHIEQAIVILVVLIPLWVVLANRVRAAKWNEVPADALNGAWRPPELQEAPHEAVPEAEPARSISPVVSAGAPIVALAGLAAWIFAGAFHTDAPPIRINRAAAVETARQELTRQGIQLDASWVELSSVQGQPGEQNRFVWQEAGRERYEKLLGLYVTPPGWFVRFARFRGDVAERAEEYQVYLDGDGKVLRLNHNLPEGRTGKNLTENDARAMALATLQDVSPFEEISAEASRKPARTDWTFVFKDTRDYGLPEGEPRVSIEIAGDQVVDTTRYIYVPEEWSRNERARQNLPTIFGAICTILLICVVAAGAVLGVVRWSRKRGFSVRAFFAVFVAVLALNTINVLNNWPVLAAQAVTTQPLELQLAITVAISLLLALFTAAALGLVAGFVTRMQRATLDLSFGRRVLLGASIALAMAGIGALARQLLPSISPSWGNLGPESAFLPFVSAALGPLGGFFSQVLTLLIVLHALQRRSRAVWLWIVAGIVLTGSSGIQTVSSWLIMGGAAGLLLMLAYLWVFRHEPDLLKITVAALLILATIRDGLQQPFPAALPAAIVAAVLVAAAAWVWLGAANRGAGRSPA